MIAFTCPVCRKSLKAPDEAAGRDARCSGCRATFAIPYPGDTGPVEMVDDEPLFVRRRRRSNAPPAIAIAAVFLLGAITVLVVVIALMRNSSPREIDSTRNEPARTTTADDDDDSYWVEEKTGKPLKYWIRLAIGLIVYFTPSAIAIARGHNNIVPVLVVNFFLGCTLLGWVVALAWAFTDLKHLEEKRRSWL